MPDINTAHRRLTAIMFTDLVGYSALTQRNEAPTEWPPHLSGEECRLRILARGFFGGRVGKGVDGSPPPAETPDRNP